MTMQTITSLFDSREHANQAVLKLHEAGIPEANITVSPDTAALDYSDAEHSDKGFWATLEEMFGGTEDHKTYAEGLRRGGTLVTAHVDDHMVDEVITILEEHGSVDMNEKETSWRSEGWTGATAMTSERVASDSMALTGSTPAPVMGSSASSALTAQPISQAKGEGVLQVVEEQLDVGKRAVNRGKVRLHSYVVEKAVSEDVTLRNETVSIDRRPVNRAIGVAELGVDPFKDRTIEMEEIDEEAVVAKTARVVEEIGIRKDVSDRIQTINDSVRSTKVDIEDGRTTNVSSLRTASEFATQIADNMDVIGSDGQHVGIIDHVDGDMIKLKKMDPASGGQHHLIPMSWIKSVEDKVMLSTTAVDAKSRWTAV